MRGKQRMPAGPLTVWGLAGGVGIMLAGCGELALPPESPSPPPVVKERRSPINPPGIHLPQADSPQPAPWTGAQPDQPPPVAEQPVERVAAEAGVGRRGRGYGGGVITEPIRQRFRIEQRLVYDVQIPQALQLYRANDPYGRGPQSHEEFMEHIIQANDIQLPQLPEGERYAFDPQTQQLMVERPRRPDEVLPE